MNLRAKFLETASTEAAVRALTASGFGPGDIEVYSTEPVEFGPDVLDRPSRMSLYAVLGALLNGSLATAFMFYTQVDYPLVTGGMPLVSGWATGVITFEMTMAGAVAGTMLGFLWEGRLFRNGVRVGPPPELSDDSILVQLRCDDQDVPRASEMLYQAGAVTVESLERA